MGDFDVKVYILLEHHQRDAVIDEQFKAMDVDANILGVYADREGALLASARYAKQHPFHGYLAVISKTVKGEIVLDPRTTRISLRLLPIAKRNIKCYKREVKC